MYENSCQCGRKKYCFNGEIDYSRITTQHELGEVVAASEAESCTTIEATAGFVGSDIDDLCPDDLECPCVVAEFPMGICDEPDVAVEPLPDCSFLELPGEPGEEC